MPQSRRRKSQRGLPGRGRATPQNIGNLRFLSSVDTTPAAKEEFPLTPTPPFAHPSLKHPPRISQTASTAVDDASASQEGSPILPTFSPSSTDSSVAPFPSQAGSPSPRSTSPCAVDCENVRRRVQTPESRSDSCWKNRDIQPDDNAHSTWTLSPSSLPSPATVLLSCGAVVLTWLQDPILSLVASAVTAAAPSLSVSGASDADLAAGIDREATSRNVAVASVGVSGQLCDGLAALTIGIGITTAVLCSSASKKEESCPTKAGSETSTRSPTRSLLSDPPKGFMSVPGSPRSGNGSATAKLGVRKHGGDFEAGEKTASVQSPHARTDNLDLVCLRTCIVGVWISAYTGALLSLLLWLTMSSLLAFFFSASSSHLLLFLTRKCISLRLLSLPFSIISLTAKAALLALRDPLPPVISAVAAAASIPLLLTASFFSHYMCSFGDTASSFLSSAETSELPVSLSLEEALRPSEGAFQNGLTPAEVADYHRIRCIVVAVVFTQIIVALVLLVRLFQRTLALVRSQRDRGMERSGEEAVKNTTSLEKGEWVNETNQVLHPNLEGGKETVCRKGRDERSLLVALLQLPTNSELLEFSPFLASCLVQSTVRVVLYSTMMKVSASWGVKALAAYQVASSVYTVHGLPCEALTQVTQSIIRNAESLVSETSWPTSGEATSAGGSPEPTRENEGRDRSCFVSEKSPATQSILCGGESPVCGIKHTPQDLIARRASVMRHVHRRLLRTAGWMGLGAAVSAACVGFSFCLRLQSSSRGLAATLLGLCLASTPALALVPVTAALEGLLLHAKRLRTIACAYLVSLPLPLLLLLHSHVSNSGEDSHAPSAADKLPGIPGESDAGDAYNDTPVYGVAIVWLLPLVYNLGRAGVYGLAWCRARYEAEVAEKDCLAVQHSKGDALC
ncbi:putative transmembrane protein [Toxoplasma gondii TgCatPRC2]|uniref:Transmembrane protein n=4 Tax=Toxoplasma gondii TaxID=5811 RepID=S8F3P7_TOXGM|nr:hypothetical protein TGME49_291940 [Toxoplasma gondii ME49]ESS33992.1 putative transmembrane protein [Toxoplasma gondii VEG]KYF44944.1 hypothetical protein TGARI_291940 [Toxoplasma gondii ARI]KYK69757.1 putative transmembrane protein [Toxoplasma gondii TgCatPRC2]EPT28108.1 hypothetical protein TGME49_291940 [Toxoplasma gondii ME49]CEL76090.1 TPA: hypothetical protein BN1205_084970 [Toxoplasma gondii VEG]|eukprot:XP_002368536.2 hypothetical protein TGME49_291940 [Toxoplasma gondii ME49]